MFGFGSESFVRAIGNWIDPAYKSHQGKNQRQSDSPEQNHPGGMEAGGSKSVDEAHKKLIKNKKIKEKNKESKKEGGLKDLFSSKKSEERMKDMLSRTFLNSRKAERAVQSHPSIAHELGTGKKMPLIGQIGSNSIIPLLAPLISLKYPKVGTSLLGTKLISNLLYKGIYPTHQIQDTAYERLMKTPDLLKPKK